MFMRIANEHDKFVMSTAYNGVQSAKNVSMNKSKNKKKKGE